MNLGRLRYGSNCAFITPEIENFRGAKIVTVGILSGDELLTGQRRDNGLWVSPGGHVDQGEEFKSAAVREVAEEAGIRLDPRTLELIRAEKLISPRTGKEFVVVAYLARLPKGSATARFDPDQEVSIWKWVKVLRSTPELQRDARHAKNDFILEYLLGGYL
jgi:8-oxo-dGTP pyrophosphatase MutT (NUDIX family)